MMSRFLGGSGGGGPLDKEPQWALSEDLRLVSPRGLITPTPLEGVFRVGGGLNAASWSW